MMASQWLSPGAAPIGCAIPIGNRRNGGMIMNNRPDWDDQFAESEDERNERLRAKRLRYDKERRTIVAPDPRDPDHMRAGMFILHNCYRCKDGREPCIKGNPRQCEYPHARND
jgi:hypothetical protein